ncbi:uncharacterized protein LOC143540009 [Bidens hawaiensis]|uniref:uncharacterized protein LOC143540009 n=1 Tax=Bidens hawaiensis TaxID=980011 RepID=UPI00404A9FB9
MNKGSNKIKPISRTGILKENREPRACSSVESNTSDLAKQEGENSSTSTLTSDHSKHQEKKCLAESFQTSSETSKLLTSIKINLRRSCATRPAARMVVANDTRCSEGSSSNSNVDPTKSKKYILRDAQNRLTTLKGATKNVGSKVTTKEKVQQRASVGKVLIPRDNNKQNERVGIGKRTASLATTKETKPATMAKCVKDKSSVKMAQPIMPVPKAASKENMTQKNGTKKLIGVKEKIANKSRDADTAKPARKVYFR